MTVEHQPACPADEPSATNQRADSELLAFYRAEIRFESEMVNGRLQALLGSQAFLVIAYASAMTGSTTRWGDRMVLLVPPLFCLLGFILALMALPGIRAGYAAIGKWDVKQRELLGLCPHLSKCSLATNDDEARDTTRLGHRGALFAHQAPLVFLIAWVIFSLIPFYLYLGATPRH